MNQDVLNVDRCADLIGSWIFHPQILKGTRFTMVLCFTGCFSFFVNSPKAGMDKACYAYFFLLPEWSDVCGDTWKRFIHLGRKCMAGLLKADVQKVAFTGLQLRLVLSHFKKVIQTFHGGMLDILIFSYCLLTKISVVFAGLPNNQIRMAQRLLPCACWRRNHGSMLRTHTWHMKYPK